jgi:hypothetical protein
MNLNIAQVHSERVIGIGCSASRQQGLLRELELIVPFSTSDFAGDGFRFKTSGTEKHQGGGRVWDIRAIHSRSRADSRNAAIR